MKRTLLFLFLVPLLIKAQNFPDKADAYLSVLYNQKKFTGTVLVAKAGKIIFQKAYGWENQRLNRPNTIETEYRIASLTKQFTAALILQLSEKRKLNVQDPLSKYIPDYPKGDSITLDNLLSHTSGIKDINALQGNKADIERADLKSKVELFKQVPLNFKPGTKFEYSNSNYIILSLIAEKVSGTPYKELLQTQILDKAGMQHSGIDQNERQSKHRAIGYTLLNNDPWKLAAYRNMDGATGAGGMYSTVGDLYKWDRALYQTTILSDNAKKQMFSPKKGNYGYGYIITRGNGRLEYTHNGITNGFMSIISRFPDDDACIIILSNSRQVQPGVVKKGLANLLFN